VGVEMNCVEMNFLEMNFLEMNFLMGLASRPDIAGTAVVVAGIGGAGAGGAEIRQFTYFIFKPFI
jgi:hypothetical protein